MAKLGRAFIETGVSRTILFCLVFVGLNILDAWLTGIALGAENWELNPFLGTRLGSNVLFKGLLSAAIVLALVLFKRDRLLKPLNLGMTLICLWNGLVVCFWS